MIKIAIYDGERAELDRACRQISAFFENERIEHRIIPVKELSELREQVFEPGAFDILMLDASAQALELAARLREQDFKGEIIFTAQTPDKAYEAYRVNAIQYLLKPYQKSELHSALRRAAAIIKNASPDCALLKTSDGLRRIAWSEVVNSYTVGHYQLIVLSDGEELKYRATSDGLYSVLKESGYFMKVGSYIINVSRVKEIRSREIELDSGVLIPLPKNSYKLIKKEFSEKQELLWRI